jgi:hypothetical protein
VLASYAALIGRRRAVRVGAGAFVMLLTLRGVMDSGVTSVLLYSMLPVTAVYIALRMEVSLRRQPASPDLAG